MSKKTRKKSSKPSTGKAIRAQSATSAKKAPLKTRKASATKSSTNIKSRQTGKATAKASHKAPSKKLKSPGPAKSAPRATSTPKTPAAKPPMAKPAVTKTAVTKPAAEKPSVATLPLKKPSDETAAPRPAPPAAASGPSSGPLAEGSKAPAFSLPRDGGSTVSLGDYAGKKLVLFFYPRADTPGCTKEAIDFTRLAGAFAEAQTAVLGVSADPLKAQEAFRNKHELATPLVSDEQHEMLEAYGAWGEKSMYGRTFLGVLRTTVLIGKDGRIIRIWRHVKVDGHADEVLAAAQAG
ncbi:peroxiredoxin [Bradyrhizobium sp. dw_411]|uniref:peroxiredoxin n=1 Tax=Bradyrhizobium sp. dw_411 TaxID=2720082 RepID=UPI001BD105EA|nr:peroxiredoxin [Bradyrhizobium sp. dw_411]